MKKEKDPKKARESLIHALKLLVIIIAAFITGLIFRQSAGIIAMTPAAFIICLGAALIKFDMAIKILIFGATVFCMNTIEQKDMQMTVIYTALCLLACCVFEIARNRITAKKKHGFIIGAAGLAACIGLSFIFIGNPIDAIKAESVITEYTDAKYPSEENAVLGEFEFSNIYYDYRNGRYSMDAVSDKYPTESGVIALEGYTVTDSFGGIMEEKLSEPYVLEITALLRDYFPDDSFSIKYDEIASIPGESVFSSGEGALYGDITFEITLGGVQTANTMTEKVKRYTEVIDGSGLEYGKIIYKSGISPWVRRSATVDSNMAEGFEKYLIQHVPAETSNRFNRYISSFLDIPLD